LGEGRSIRIEAVGFEDRRDLEKPARVELDVDAEKGGRVSPEETLGIAGVQISVRAGEFGLPP